MQKYVITRSNTLSETSSDLYHADQKKHKYIVKIKRTNGKYRYFYDKEEYQRYLKGKDILDSTTKALKDVKDDVSGIKKKVDKYLNKKKDKKLDGIALIYTKEQVEKVISFISKKLGLSKSDKKIEEKANKKTHKYIEKVKLPNGKYRYFYKQEEYDAYMKRLEYQRNEPDFMKNLPKIDPNVIMNADEHMAEINEEYNFLYDARSMNCAYCTTAYEMRMRGYDVQAADYEEDTYDALPWGIDAWYKNGDMEYISPNGNTVDINMYTDSNKESMHNKLFEDVLRADDDIAYTAEKVRYALETNNPPNSRGNLCVYWEGGGGHSMAYEIDSKGRIIIRDCQVNEIYTVEQLVDMGVRDVFYMRTDNLEFSEKALHTVEAN